MQQNNQQPNTQGPPGGNQGNQANMFNQINSMAKELQQITGGQNQNPQMQMPQQMPQMPSQQWQQQPQQPMMSTQQQLQQSNQIISEIGRFLQGQQQQQQQLREQNMLIGEITRYMQAHQGQMPQMPQQPMQLPPNQGWGQQQFPTNPLPNQYQPSQPQIQPAAVPTPNQPEEIKQQAQPQQTQPGQPFVPQAIYQPPGATPWSNVQNQANTNPGRVSDSSWLPAGQATDQGAQPQQQQQPERPVPRIPNYQPGAIIGDFVAHQLFGPPAMAAEQPLPLGQPIGAWQVPQSGQTLEEANASFGAFSAILMVLALAFLTMGAMDYYANDKVEDKEYEREMAKRSTKEGLLGYGHPGANNIEDSLPEYQAVEMPEATMGNQQPLIPNHNAPAPGDRAQMVAGLSSEGAGTGEREKRNELSSGNEISDDEPGKRKKKREKVDKEDKFDKV